MSKKMLKLIQAIILLLSASLSGAIFLCIKYMILERMNHDLPTPVVLAISVGVGAILYFVLTYIIDKSLNKRNLEIDGEPYIRKYKRD